MSYSLKEFEDYLRRKNPGKYDKRVSNVYLAKSSSTAPKNSTKPDTVRPRKPRDAEKMFYADEGNSGIMRQNGYGEGVAGNGSGAESSFRQADNGIVDIKRYADPYAQTWTPEQQTRKRLHDAQIKRDNLEASFFSMPTTKEVVKLGEYDDEIKRLTQQLGQGEQNSMLPTMSEPIQRYSQPEASESVPEMGYDVPMVGNDAHAGAYVKKEDLTEAQIIERSIDKELRAMIPNYIKNTVAVLDGPNGRKGGKGWNEILEGVIGVIETIPGLQGIGEIIPEIPSNPYKRFIVSADFEFHDGIENDEFQVNLYKDGTCKVFWRGVAMEN